MTQFQVTARFGHRYEIVGDDVVDRAKAYELADFYFHNVCRDVRVHKLIGNGSVVHFEWTHEAAQPVEY